MSSFLWKSPGSFQYFLSRTSKENRERGWPNTHRAKCEGLNRGHRQSVGLTGTLKKQTEVLVYALMQRPHRINIIKTYHRN